MNRAIVLLALLGAVALGAGVFSWVTHDQPPEVAETPVKLLFSQQYPDAQGAKTDLNAYRGQVLVVNFWASWCAPCIEEMPELSELQSEMAARDVQFLGLAIDNAANVRKFINGPVQVIYPLLVLDAAGIELGRRFGNEAGALPFTVVIDRNGNITDRTLGRVDIARLRRVILRTVDSGS
jgi:thiol-disulfide isomerase/thioredoxin